MEKIHLILAIIGAAVTIISSVGGAYIAVRVIITRHDEKLSAVKEELDILKANRENDFREIRADIKNLYRNIASLDKGVGILLERTKGD